MAKAPTLALLLIGTLALGGCARLLPRPQVPGTVGLVEAPGWKTLTAEHRVTVAVRRDDGRTDTRTLRGVIAVERPARFRLRALGPAGITLFDLRVRDGKAEVIAAIRAPGDRSDGQALSEVISSLAADLACAYALEPRPAARSVRLDGDAVLVEEPGRRVHLTQFAGVPALWHHAEIETPRYHVTVEVDGATLDAALDPELFSE